MDRQSDITDKTTSVLLTNGIQIEQIKTSYV